ncbi:MAG: hypothetical protein IPO60_13770 [Flavobacteriales bacterium]|jgi:hypothetical protein|nr:hypothetical protein [Flavobacteriales bacterium]MBK6893570.1 hypothetical protein [Flavobacteriales bacterium]MBK7248730.1 hypothetical protein [Flavobacteriales bacterium]MBK7287621.1 hypothetical protein [Flavobacteriales bacterium]MBK9059044.1 hypothetical protein [Flavobacteriales bacterium]
MNSNWAKILLFSILFGVLGFILGRMCGNGCGTDKCGPEGKRGSACMMHGGMKGDCDMKGEACMHGKKGKCCTMKGDSAMAGHDMDDHHMMMNDSTAGK